MTPRVPFNHPTLIGNEAAYVAQALASGHISGDGAFTTRCHALLERALGAPRVLLTSSCTHALEMAALLLDLQPGDEVVAPSFTFVSTVNAFVLRGARPVFVDIRSDTLNLDERQLERALSSRTRAIVVVHYAGIACEMDTISALAAGYGIPIVEDNAHGLFGRYRGRWLGTLGSLATLSFHETKNYTCGEGGALVINDPHLVARAEVLREKGTNRSRFFRGEVDKYTWVDLGSSYLPSDLSAAMLLGQLEEREHVQARRKELFDRYMEGLWDWAHTSGVGLPQIPSDCTPAYHLFYVRLPNEAMRSRFIKWLDSQGVHSVFHYVPLHTSPMGQRYGYAAGDLPITEAVSDQLARLPFFFGLSRAQQDRVIQAAVSFPMDAA
jgi:dTDP-4-amino-4,6-dideoxygalactose transaminase